VIAINLSVWDSYEALHDFIHRGMHGPFRTSPERIVQASTSPTTALWWLPVSQLPTPNDAVKRLRHLRRYGPTPQAFMVRRRFDPNGRREQTHTNWAR